MALTRAASRRRPADGRGRQRRGAPERPARGGGRHAAAARVVPPERQRREGHRTAEAGARPDRGRGTAVPGRREARRDGEGAAGRGRAGGRHDALPEPQGVRPTPSRGRARRWRTCGANCAAGSSIAKGYEQQVTARCVVGRAEAQRVLRRSTRSGSSSPSGSTSTPSRSAWTRAAGRPAGRPARAKAEEVRKQLTTARRSRTWHGDTRPIPTAQKGGDMGLVHRGSLSQDFEAVTKSLPLGEPSAVVETIYGYHIIRVTEILPPRARSFADVGARLQQDLSSERCASAKDAWIARLRNAATHHVSAMNLRTCVVVLATAGLPAVARRAEFRVGRGRMDRGRNRQHHRQPGQHQRRVLAELLPGLPLVAHRPAPAEVQHGSHVPHQPALGRRQQPRRPARQAGRPWLPRRRVRPAVRRLPVLRAGLARVRGIHRRAHAWPIPGGAALRCRRGRRSRHSTPRSGTSRWAGRSTSPACRARTSRTARGQVDCDRWRRARRDTGRRPVGEPRPGDHAHATGAALPAHGIRLRAHAGLYPAPRQPGLRLLRDRLGARAVDCARRPARHVRGVEPARAAHRSGRQAVRSRPRATVSPTAGT